MRRGSSISKAQLDSGALAVQEELWQMGFWNCDSRLPSTDVYWCSMPQVTMPGALGFFVHEATLTDKLLGFEAGHIYIPRWVLAQGLWQNRGSLRDVLRHEYAHAIAHRYPSLIRRSSRFAIVFGGRYGDGDSAGAPESDFVSGYARTCPCEDFAETFMFFLRHGGVLPARFSSRALKRKWRFVADLGSVIKSGQARWP